MRDAGRATLVKMAGALGPKYLQYIVKEMKAMLTRGYMVQLECVTFHMCMQCTCMVHALYMYIHVHLYIVCIHGSNIMYMYMHDAHIYMYMYMLVQDIHPCSSTC